MASIQGYERTRGKLKPLMDGSGESGEAGSELDSRELLLGEIYKAMLGAAPLASALRVLADLTSSDKAFWGCFDRKRRVGDFIDSFNAELPFIEQYSSNHSRHNAWLARTQYFQAEGLIWRGSKILPMHDLMATTFYKEYLAPQQIYHTLHIVILVDGDCVVHVMLTRPQHEQDFGKGEIELARCFALHARRAADSQRLVAGLKMVKLGLSEVIDDAGLGVAILDPPAVIYASETCERILASLGARSALHGEGYPRQGERILFPRAVADAINGHDYARATRLILDPPDRGAKVLVEIKPIHFRGLTRLDRRIGLVMTLRDLNQRIFVDEELLQRAYELTASEVRVCSLLANDECVEDISYKLRISPNTARTHIKRIFSKTGSSRQAGLVKLILSTGTRRRASQAVALSGADETIV